MLNLGIGSESHSLKLLCLGAHCDDIEIGCGGTLLSLIAQQKVSELYWIVFTSTPRRAEEAKRSADNFIQRVNAQVKVLSFRDAFLPNQATEVKEVFESIKTTFQPDLIFTHYRQDRHQDHRLISDFTWNTFRHHLILEYEIPKYDGDMGQPNVYVPLSQALIDQKIALTLTGFPSQQHKHWFDHRTLSALPRLRGVECASEYAEAFYGRKLMIN